MLDLTALVPASVTVVFPRSDSGELTTTDYTIAVALTTLNIAEYRGITGYPATKLIPSSALANFDLTGTLLNSAELQLLAQRIARDFYLWRLASLEIRYASAVPWIAEGMHDIEFRHDATGIFTSIHRAEWEPNDGEGKHSGSYGGKDDAPDDEFIALISNPGLLYTNNVWDWIEQIADPTTAGFINKPGGRSGTALAGPFLFEINNRLVDSPTYVRAFLRTIIDGQPVYSFEVCCCSPDATSTTTSTTTTHPPCSGNCLFQWDNTLKKWTQTASTCSSGCVCIPPDFCWSVDGDYTLTGCGFVAGPPTPPCDGTTTTTTSTTTTTTVQPGCTSGCDWLYMSILGGWVLRANGCSFTCPCPDPGGSPTECQTAHTDCATTTTTTLPPQCYGTATYYCDESNVWQFLDGGCTHSGFYCPEQDCYADPPTVPCICGAVTIQDCWPHCTSTTPPPTTTTTHPPCGAGCLWNWHSVAATWTLYENFCSPSCACLPPPFKPTGFIDTIVPYRGKCANTSTTTTSTTTTSTTTTTTTTTTTSTTTTTTPCPTFATIRLPTGTTTTTAAPLPSESCCGGTLPDTLEVSTTLTDGTCDCSAASTARPLIRTAGCVWSSDTFSICSGMTVHWQLVVKDDGMGNATFHLYLLDVRFAALMQFSGTQVTPCAMPINLTAALPLPGFCKPGCHVFDNTVTFTTNDTWIAPFTGYVFAQCWGAGGGGGHAGDGSTGTNAGGGGGGYAEGLAAVTMGNGYPITVGAGGVGGVSGGDFGTGGGPSNFVGDTGAGSTIQGGGGDRSDSGLGGIGTCGGDVLSPVTHTGGDGGTFGVGFPSGGGGGGGGAGPTGTGGNATAGSGGTAGVGGAGNPGTGGNGGAGASNANGTSGTVIGNGGGGGGALTIGAAGGNGGAGGRGEVILSW